MIFEDDLLTYNHSFDTVFVTIKSWDVKINYFPPWTFLYHQRMKPWTEEERTISQDQEIRGVGVCMEKPDGTGG